MLSGFGSFGLLVFEVSFYIFRSKIPSFSSFVAKITSFFFCCIRLIMEYASKRTFGKSVERSVSIVHEDEDHVVSLAKVKKEGAEEEITKRILAGKIITSKNLNRSGIRGAFKQLWENLQDVSFLEGGNNTFAFTFQSQEEAQQVWNKKWGDLTPPTP